MMPVKSAEKLLSLAQKGLPVIFVNGVTETVRPFGITKTHKKAASLTPFLSEHDQALDSIISQIKRFPNVKETDEQSEVYTILKNWGVEPAAEFLKRDTHILTHVREDSGWLYIYTYNMKYTDTKPHTFTIRVSGEGRPYILDCWNGNIEALAVFSCNNGHTSFELTLAPGEACICAVDLNDKTPVHIVETNAEVKIDENQNYLAQIDTSGEYKVIFSDGREINFDVEAPDDIELKVWYLESATTQHRLLFQRAGTISMAQFYKLDR